MSRQEKGSIPVRRCSRGLRLMAAAWAMVLLAGPASLQAGEETGETLLLGRVEPEQILKISPEWKAMHDAASPDAVAVEKIRAAAGAAQENKEKLLVEVVFGSWCEDSLNHVPGFIKLQELLGAGRLPATYVGVDRARKDPDGIVTSLKIEKVPTFIVYRDRKEIGRIVETPLTTLEGDLAEILARPAKP
jgi:hypothetical protein